MNPIVPPLKAGDRGDRVADLQDALLLLLQRAAILASEDERRSLTTLLQRERQPVPSRRAMGILPSRETPQPVYGEGTGKAVTLFQQTHQLPPTGQVDEPTASAINAALKEMEAIPAGQSEARSTQDQAVATGQPRANPHSPQEPNRPEQIELPFTVEGKVVSRERPGVGGLKVQIVDKNVGEKGDVLLAETTTGNDGGYRVTFSAAKIGKQRPDLQARVLAGQALFGVSDVRYDASNRETLNVLLTPEASSSLPSEHATLTGTLAVHFKGSLRDLKETDERQDITYLANKTGWDARAVALAALADQFSSKTKDAGDAAGIEPPFFYALLRADVGTNEDALYQVDANTAERIWRQGIEQGVIPPELQKEIPRAAERFQSLAARRALDGPALTGLSSLKQMLSVSLGDDPAKQKKFGDLYTRHKADPPKMWEAVRAAFGEAAEKRLRVDGQLGYLTLNNAPLIRKLHASNGRDGITDTVSLARNGFYRAEKWRQLMANDAIPAEITGKSDKEKRTRYAELLAAQVRLSFPTAVVAEMVKSGETPVGNDAQKDDVHAFLAEHHGKFEIGRHPVQRYIARNKLQVPAQVAKEIARIQRVYQITPSDAAMNALLKRGIDSALAVSRYDRDQFVRMYKDDLDGEANARLTHAKAQQVHSAVFNIASSYLVARTAPQIGVHSAAKYVNTALRPVAEAQRSLATLQPASAASILGSGWVRDVIKAWGSQSPENAADIIPYATLENLFGEMDYCSCEHCRSVLSPAAYLVDLLHFLDREDNDPQKAWTDFLERWKSEHQGATYPFERNQDWVDAEKPDPRTPLQVLLGRRPDIERLPLTCENTNTPLPYIDLVNETLEYYVTNNLSLSAYRGHDTGSTVSLEELLASPQYVQDTAYDSVLKNAVFPPPLPFHQALESLRRYFEKFETPLPAVMEALRRNDNLERSNDKEYGWRDILMEELRLSRDEYRLLTDHNHTIQELYGFAPTDDALFGIRNAGKDDEERFGLTYAKAFSRRVGLSYEEIVELLNTRFVNPKLPQNGIVEKPIDGLITLAGSQDELCNFDKMEFRYYRQGGGETKLRAFEFVRMVRFIRLWKKVSWTIEQTDKAITALYPANLLPTNPNATEEETLEKLDAGFLVLLPRLGVIKRVMDALKLKPKKDLLPLLACFAPIDAHGAQSLYRQMFLPPKPPPDEKTTSPEDPFAADDQGNYLTNGVSLADVEIAGRLRAAFLITDEELSHIAADLKFDGKSTLLKLAEPAKPPQGQGAISAIFRRGWLARKLKLSVRELLLLTRSTGIDPFAPPDPPDQANNRPGPAIMRFIDLVDRLRAAALKPEQALYLIWNQDVSGKSAPDQAEILAFARTLRTAFAAAESEFALIDDPTGEIARARMALVYGNEATTFFFGLLDNTFVTEVVYDHGQPALEQAILDAVPGRIAYDDFRKRLSFSGVMTDGPDGHVQALQLAGGTQKFKDAIKKDGTGTDPGTGLYNENQKVIAPFFERYPELAPLQDVYTFFGGLSTWVDYQHPKDTLEPDIVKAGEGRIAYDAKLLRLSFKGIMTESVRVALKAGGTTEFATAVGTLFDKVDQLVNAYFQKFSNRFPAHPPLDQTAYRAANDSREARLSLLLADFLPELKRRRKRQQALQAVATATGSDIAFASALLENKLVVNPAAASDAEEPALLDLTAIEELGLSAQFFDGATIGTTPSSSSDTEANLDYSATGSTALPYTKTSAVWGGYLEVPENDFYNVYIETDGTQTPKLMLDGKEVSLQQPGQDAPSWNNEDPVELRAGTLYPITLTVAGVENRLTVRWETKGRGREVITPRFLYSGTLTDRLRTTYIRFLKTAALAGTLKLTAAETVHLAADAAYQIQGRGWLNRLPAKGSADAVTSRRLCNALGALIEFALIKARLSPNDERLLTVLKDPAATIVKSDQTSESLLLALTRWDQAALDKLLPILDAADATALKELPTFMRVYRALDLVKRIGISAVALIDAATNEPNAETVRKFKAALRARYDETDWLGVLRPINDALRALQRDALVAYILESMSLDAKTRHIDTPDKLFEYFLMDVQMDPCMQTSRIRHALSSVQLFIERCFLNLEPQVAPDVFLDEHRKQWAWMKRYRVWEANRKVFLWPENWLEPELRDDQSPFFKEAMSELLQSDITEDRAATALLNYLSKLEEVAKLEPCGIHYFEGVPHVSNPVAHVVARTAGASRKYYYRRREGLPEVGAGTWTPWELIKLDIEDNPVIPVVWKGRLFLFWLRILKEAPLVGQQVDTGEATKLQELPVTAIRTDPPLVNVQAVLCWSEYYNGKWQPTKTSDVNRPIMLEQSVATGPDSFERTSVVLWAMKAEEERALLIYSVNSTTWYTLYNSHSLPIQDEADSSQISSAISIFGAQRFRELEPGSDPFTIAYGTGIYPYVSNAVTFSRPVLQAKDTSRYRGAEPLHNLQNMWEAPLFYEDSRHVFYVTPKKGHARVSDWGSYAYHPSAVSDDVRIPPTVIRERQRPGPRPVTSKLAIALARGSSVRFGGVQIGIAGRVNDTGVRR